MMLLLIGSILLAACGGDDTGSTTTNESANGSATTEEPSDDPEPVEEEEVDNCSLITADEATALAGYDLEQGEDSFLGCSYIPPGSSVADVVVKAVLIDGDAASIAAEGFPNAAEIIPVGVGEDTVAVTTPAGDAVASVITASGGRLVELAIVFLLIEPTDSARIEEAATLAVTALGRWSG
jgi:hypothetical protein